MSVSIVFDGQEFRCLRRVGNQLIGRSCPAEYTALPASESLSGHLDQAKIPYGRCDERIILLGPRAIDFARSLQLPRQPLLPNGDLSPSDALLRQMIASLFEVLLPDASHPGQPCAVALPTVDERPQRNFITQLIQLRGYVPVPIRTSMALVLAELGMQSFTGVGIAFEAGLCSVSLSHSGIEMAGCCIPTTDSGLESGTAVTGTDTHNLSDQWLKESIENVVRQASDAIVSSAMGLSVPQPVSIVCSGGPAHDARFRGLFTQALQDCRFPLHVREINVPDDRRYSVARGCLIHAELEARAQSTSAVA